MESNALKTDLYELTMAAGYFHHKMTDRATFELFCHSMPDSRAYLVACGLQQAVEYILSLSFTDDDVAFLRSHPSLRHVTPAFFDALKRFRFSGDVWSVPEGEIVFADEPMLQVTAPIMEAQILETYLLSIFNIETLVASKAARVVHAANADGQNRDVVDFGSRRAHGPEAGLLAARASYLAGCAGTSNVEAGRMFGIPSFGTVAHSWVEAFLTEEESFAKYAEVFPKNIVLLIDTYDTMTAMTKILRMGLDVRAVRIDSGDIAVISKNVRNLLDKNNRKDVKIIASGNLNEFKIRDLVKAKAPVDIFGVGTDMATSRDCPALDLTYKLVQMENAVGQVSYKFKTSPGKATVPGRKQVFRHLGTDGKIVKDTISQFHEKPLKGARPLLEEIISSGRLVKNLPETQEIRTRIKNNYKQLPLKMLRSLDSWGSSRSNPVDVLFSKDILALQQKKIVTKRSKK